MASFRDRLGNVWSSLTLRVLVLLTLTIAPIGAIAVFQTARLAETLDARAVDALVAATLEAVMPERVALEHVLGGAEALSRTAPDQTADTDACHAVFSRAISGDDGYGFLGILTPYGATCTAPESSLTLDAQVANRLRFDTTEPVVLTAELTGFEHTVVAQPVTVNGGVVHYVLLTLAPRFQPEEPAIGTETPEAIVLLTPAGEIVRASASFTNVSASLPSDWPQPDFAAPLSSRVFFETAVDGSERAYASVPVLGGQLVALVVWPLSRATLPGGSVWPAPWFFPILMWLATLVISYIAINRVVVRHVRHLGMHMRRFARNKMIPPAEMVERQPVEFTEINSNFRAMATAIVQDEAELENAVHEKTLLLREVHHRVKNNLQLIASIMNMQIRRSENRETTSLIRRLQDRVLGLAAIHRQMYEAQALDRVPADQVLGSILDQVVRFEPNDPVAFSRDLETVALVQDQAVPLALLAAEAVTNAVGYLGTNAKGDRALRVSLERVGARGVRLAISNTLDETGTNAQSDFDDSQAGLGMQLITAFTRQLEGQADKRTADGVYQLTLTFQRVAHSSLHDDDGGAGASSSPPNGDEPGHPRASVGSTAG